eukprot:758185-Hanusia_phi.AAC.4
MISSCQGHTRLGSVPVPAPRPGPAGGGPVGPRYSPEPGVPVGFSPGGQAAPRVLAGPPGSDHARGRAVTDPIADRRYRGRGRSSADRGPIR